MLTAGTMVAAQISDQAPGQLLRWESLEGLHRLLWGVQDKQGELGFLIVTTVLEPAEFRDVPARVGSSIL